MSSGEDDVMKATFNDFVQDNPNCSKFHTDPAAISIFNLLSQDANIIAMIDASEAGKPALSACVSNVETYARSNQKIDLNDGFTRTVIGRMIKTILKPFGYEVDKPKNLPKSSGATYFTSASCYKMTGNATMKVIRTIVPIDT